MRCPCCGSQAVAMIHRCASGGRCRLFCMSCECDSLGAIGPDDRHPVPSLLDRRRAKDIALMKSAQRRTLDDKEVEA